MTQFNLASAGVSSVRQPRYSEAELRRFLTAHETFVRGEPGGQRAIWRYVQAAGCDFSGRQFTLADLTGANLQRCRLAKSDFRRACLQLADLREVDAAGADFSLADIRGVSLRRSNLSGAVFDQADLRQAVLSPAGVSEDFRVTGKTAPGEVVFEVDFTHCSMRGVRLNHARLNRANFSGAHLADADLSGADLRGGRFRGAILTGAQMGDAKIDPGALDGCVLDPTPYAIGRAGLLQERLASADRWIASDGAEGGAAELDGEDLRPLAEGFANRRLPALSARRACGVAMSFAGAQLQGARFDDADLRDADFTGADLRGASFRGAKLRYARFTGADLRPLPLARGGERAVDFTGADHAEDCFAAARRA